MSRIFSVKANLFKFVIRYKTGLTQVSIGVITLIIQNKM